MRDGHGFAAIGKRAYREFQKTNALTSAFSNKHNVDRWNRQPASKFARLAFESGIGSRPQLRAHLPPRLRVRRFERSNHPTELLGVGWTRVERLRKKELLSAHG